ncbi:MAG: c-type cytochrome, partial [Pseudomonadota bacterium]
ILALALFAVFLIFFSIWLNGQLERSDNPTRYLAKESRLSPVFSVYAGETGRAAAAAAAEAAAGLVTQVAFEGSLDGGMIYNQVCAACHTSGAAGAPMLMAADWTNRLPQGEDTLVAHAINGIGTMPARGGRMDLSDEQVRASVEYMLAQIQ